MILIFVRILFFYHYKCLNFILSNFELGSQESMNVPIRIIIGFQQQDRQYSQKLNNDKFVD